MTLEPVTPDLQNVPQIWFQHDGATVHIVKTTMDLLRQIFGERVISRNLNSPYPDYFLWDYFKKPVYTRTFSQLREEIRQEIRLLNEQTVSDIMQID